MKKNEKFKWLEEKKDLHTLKNSYNNIMKQIYSTT